MNQEFISNERPQKNGAKVGVTAIIWAFGTAMLAISIAIVSRTNDPILPITIVLAVSFSTIIIWRRDAQVTETINQLIDVVTKLEQRIIYLEKININQKKLESDLSLQRSSSKQ